MNLKLDPDTEAQVQRIAEARQQPIERVMKDAVEQYVDQEQWRLDAAAAWANYRATGLHLTGDEADAWLARLETGEDVDAPVCHV